MEIKASAKYVRMAPDKLTHVARVVRKQSTVAALRQLTVLPGKGPRILKKVIESAIANAKNNAHISTEGLKIESIDVSRGFVMKRFRAAPRGMAHGYKKMTSHITVILNEAEKPAVVTKA